MTDSPTPAPADARAAPPAPAVPPPRPTPSRPPRPATWWPWLLLAACAGLLLGLAETVWVAVPALRARKIVLWALPPTALLLTLVGYALVGLAQAPLLVVTARWLRHVTARERGQERLAIGVTAALCAGPCGFGAALAMMRYVEHFTDRPFARALVGLAAATAALLAAGLLFLVDTARAALALRWRWLHAQGAAALVAALLALGAIAVALWLFVRFGEVLQSFRVVVWLGLFVAVEALLGLLAWRVRWAARLGHGLVARRGARTALALFPLAAVLGVQGLLMAQLDAATPVLASGGMGARVLTALRRATDFDRDGVSALFGDHDCAGFNPRRNPLAFDVPGNGSDENCDGKDAKAAAMAGNASAAAVESPYFEPLPAGLNKPYNVVMVCIDALRADHLSYAGYARRTTPYLDQLAARSWAFLDVVSTSSTTRQVVPLVFTGRYHSGLQLVPHDPIDQLGEGNLFLAEILKGQGYRTIAVVDEWLPKFLPTIGQGFDVFQSAYPFGRWNDFGQHAGPYTTSLALKELARGDRKKPFFVYLHYESPHFPYVPHPEVADFGPQPVDQYDVEVAYADRQVGLMLELFAAQGLLDNTVIVLFGDHGQEFLEHGQTQHSRTLYAESVRVPLLVHVPGQKPGRFDGRESLVDVLPTLMDVLGLRPAELRPQGRSLLYRALGGRVDDERPLLGELLLLDGGKHEELRMLYRGHHKLIWNMTTGEQLLFDVRNDPAEQKPLDDPALLQQILAELKERLAAAKGG